MFWILRSGRGSLDDLWKRDESVLGLEGDRLEAVGRRGSELLSEDEKEILEWI